MQGRLTEGKGETGCGKCPEEGGGGLCSVNADQAAMDRNRDRLLSF